MENESLPELSVLESIIAEEFSSVLEKKKKKKKKKKAKKKDACYHKVKSRYKVWPSAYASGALVKCRKVGAKNWGTGGKKKNESVIQNMIMQEIQTFIDEKKKKKSKRKKAGTESSKESSLRDWFGRKGAKGKKKGWVDCNAPDGKGGYKSCGRSGGEKRKKYPACRPTPSACKERGKGKSWGKKAKKKKNESVDFNVERLIVEEFQKVLFKPGLLHHVENNIPVTENIYRPGSPCFFNVIKQARDFYNKGLYEAKNDEERDLLENSELGEWVIIEGERIPLEFPLFIDESIDEAKKKKKKKDPPIGKPMRNSGSGKKYKVYVRNPKTGKIKTITYGDSKGGLKGGWNSAPARKSFAARHKCAQKKDRTKAGYWACRAHKDFGPGVGRFW
jgi:hypothetical protein